MTFWRGLAMSQGDAAQASDDLRTALGVDGTGVTVGVLSDSFNNLGGWAADVASGDLPGPGNPNGYTNPVNVLSDRSGGGTDEGRAMLQIVHDVAPGAGLAFATAALGQAAFAQSIEDLRTIGGADVIVDDLLYFAEPFFQEGIVARAVQEAFAAGVSNVSAAGNAGNQSSESEYRPGASYNAIQFSSVPGALNFAGGVAHDFDPGEAFDGQQAFKLASGATVTLAFQWDQPFASVTGAAGASTDMHIYLLNASNQVVAASLDFNVGADPVEVLRFTNTTPTEQVLRLMLVKYEGPDPINLKYVNVTGSSLLPVDEDHPVPAGSTIYGHADAPGALTVGAAFWNSTPEFGTSPPQVESFSSLGGTALRLDADGQPLSEPGVANKPDVVAPDGGNTTFFEADSSADVDSLPNFSGTSAAAAHAAGVAALLLEAAPSATPSNLYASLRAGAVDMGGTSGFDFQTGYGLIDALAAYNDLTQQSISPPESSSIDAEALLDAGTIAGQETYQAVGYVTPPILADDYVPVDITRSYRLAGWARSGDDQGGQFNASNRQYFGFASYDADHLLIEPLYVLKFPGATDTHLAATLHPGDTQVVRDSAAGWNNAGLAHQRSLAWYGYTNSAGYTYPDFTYTRNIRLDSTNGLWNAGGINYSTNTITLRAPWSGPELPAGAAVRNAQSGDRYNYAALSFGTVPNAWTQYQATISGVGSGQTQFRHGTAYVRMLLMPNYLYSTGNLIAWRDIQWTYPASANLEAANTCCLVRWWPPRRLGR